MSEQLKPRIIGTEMEYGHACEAGPRMGWANGELNSMELVRIMRLNMPDGVVAVGDYLSDGSRFYKDIDHPEKTTPECASVDEAVLYEFAADEFVLRSLQKAQQRGYISRFILNKRVSDEKNHFHGAHESYSTAPDISPTTRPLNAWLELHMATRNIFAGAGRVSRTGFNTSQKTFSLRSTYYSIAHDDRSRPLIDTREEHLADHTIARRLHISSGDANILPFAVRIKLGTTSLVIRLAEQGFRPDITLKNPLHGAKTVAADSTLRKSIYLDDGRSITALEVQQYIAERVLALTKKVELPDDESSVLEDWLNTLYSLQTDPNKLVGQLDWVTKRAAIEHRFGDEYDVVDLIDMRAVDLAYSVLGKAAYKMRMSQLSKLGLLPALEKAIVTPPNTRASIRGAAVKSIVKMKKQHPQTSATVDWQSVKADGIELINMPDPWQTLTPDIEALLDYYFSS